MYWKTPHPEVGRRVRVEFPQTVCHVFKEINGEDTLNCLATLLNINVELNLTIPKLGEIKCYQIYVYVKTRAYECVESY
jgi:hypothetical protein